jgi:hypothetical protein
MCVLSGDEIGRVVDRLRGMEQVIAPELIRQSLVATERLNPRSCKLTHEVMMWTVLAMGLLTDMPIRQVFKHSRRLRLGEKTPHRSSLCVARKRLGVAPMRHLFSEAVRLLAGPDTPGAFYRNMRLMGFDGTVLNVPDTPANEQAFGRPTAGERGDGAFPQIRKLSLVELGTHVEVAFIAKCLRCGESTMVRSLLRHLTPDMLLLLDRGFFGYELWKELDSRQINILARVKGNVILNPRERLSDGSYVAKIYPTCYDREKDRKGIVVRVIRYKLDEPARVGHDEEHRLITTLLDEKQYPAMELIPLYHERWEEELTFDEQKTHQDPRRPTKPAHLRSETPAGVLQELYGLSLAHFTIRYAMFQAAEGIGLDPDRLSFTGCYQILKCRLPECHANTPQSLAEWYANLLWEMQQEQIAPRRNRINPRVIKQQRRSNFKTKRLAHRAQPPPSKTFVESIVVLN